MRPMVGMPVAMAVARVTPACVSQAKNDQSPSRIMLNLMLELFHHVLGKLDPAKGERNRNDNVP